MNDYHHFINNHPQPGHATEQIDVIDPATEEIFATVPRGTAADIDDAVSAARHAFEETWGQLKPRERGRLLTDLARTLEQQAQDFAELETRDSGKPLQLALRETLSTARYFEYYAGIADKLHGDQIPLGPDYIDFTIREPLGVSAQIVPWNMPLNMVGRGVAPALAAGNTVVVKPAEQTSLTALKLGDLFHAVGFPPGVYNVVTGYGPEVGEALTTHPDIDGIAFTGSVATGRRIMIAAATHIKPVVLELGGKSPHIIFADADLDLAAAEVVRGIYTNCGQICSAGSRLLVDRRIREPLLARVIERAQGIRIGPGIDQPDMGPLVSAEHYQRVCNYVELGNREGASVISGGGRPAGLARGYFMAPTIFDQVAADMRIAQEEIFGPVLVTLEFDDEVEAAAIANGTPYGLAAGIFTNDINRALRLAKRIKAGQVYVNEYYAGGEETPFGGYKQSGFGREKGLATLHSYTQIKNVAIRLR